MQAKLNQMYKNSTFNRNFKNHSQIKPKERSYGKATDQREDIENIHLMRMMAAKTEMDFNPSNFRQPRTHSTLIKKTINAHDRDHGKDMDRLRMTYDFSNFRNTSPSPIKTTINEPRVNREAKIDTAAIEKARQTNNSLIEFLATGKPSRHSKRQVLSHSIDLSAHLRRNPKNQPSQGHSVQDGSAVTNLQINQKTGALTRKGEEDKKVWDLIASNPLLQGKTASYQQHLYRKDKQ